MTSLSVRSSRGGWGLPRRLAKTELGIAYATFNWLKSSGWPYVYLEVGISRGTVRGRVDVAAASAEFSKSVAVEVKREHRPRETGPQLFDCSLAADLVYIAAPSPVWPKLDLPPHVGILEARPWPPAKSEALRLEVRLVRTAQKHKTDPQARQWFLHSVMQQARKRQPIPEELVSSRVCPACLDGRCPIWGYTAPVEDFLDLDEPRVLRE